MTGWSETTDDHDDRWFRNHMRVDVYLRVALGAPAIARRDNVSLPRLLTCLVSQQRCERPVDGFEHRYQMQLRRPLQTATC